MTDDHQATPVDALAAGDPEPGPNRRRKQVLWGVLAVLAVGVGALVTWAGDEPATRIPVAFGAAGEQAAAADMAMLANVRYVAGPGLPALGGTGPAYRLAGATTRSRVVELARALGMEGEPTRAEGTWNLRDGDRVLDVYEGLGVQWSYGTSSPEVGVDTGGSDSTSSGPACVGGPAVDCAPVDPPVTTTSPPPDPGAVAEAERAALELLAATGMDLTDAEVTVDSSAPGFWVYVVPRVEGLVAVDLGASVTLGADASVRYASGRLGRPEPVGDVAMVDTAAAIDRLNEGMGGWAAYGTAEVDAVATTSVDCAAPPDDAAAGAEAPTTTVLVGPDEPVASPDGAGAGGGVDAVEPVLPAVPPAPDCSVAPPDVPLEPVEVVLTAARVNLMALPASDGSNDGYLVPGYELDAEDGTQVTQVALAEDALEPVDAHADRPRPAPEPGAQGCAQPPPGPDGAVADICLDPGTVTTDPGQWRGGGASGDRGGSTSSPGSTPCVPPEPGPNGEVPLIGCVEGSPPAG